MRQIKYRVAAVVIGLTVLVMILLNQTLSQLQWESFHQHRTQAEALVARVRDDIRTAVLSEEKREANAYKFLLDEGYGKAESPQRSGLSFLPFQTEMPGVIGFFQIGSDNRLSSPALPYDESLVQRFQIEPSELQRRQRIEQNLREILSVNQLIVEDLISDGKKTPQKNKRSDNAFESLSQKSRVRSRQALGQLSDLKIDEKLENRSTSREIDKSKKMAPAATVPERSPSALTSSPKSMQRFEGSPELRKDSPERQNFVPILTEEAALPSDLTNDAKDESGSQNKDKQESDDAERGLSMPKRVAMDDSVQVPIFENKLAPLQASLLASGHLVFYRSLWNNGEKVVQGAVLNSEQFFKHFVENEYAKSAMYESTRLVVAHQEDVLSAYGGRQGSPSKYLDRQAFSGTLLLKAQLPAPFHNFDLIFTAQELVLGSGARLVMITGVVLILSIIAIAWLFLRYSVAQLNLMAQQQDFVSAVSHELKTPLTSIRMYGEILRQGWVGEEKRREYYDFIFFESERLSRLINNVLQLSKLTRNSLRLNLNYLSVLELSELLRINLKNPIEMAGFTYSIELTECDENLKLSVDSDVFMQIMINLIDNAIKYSSNSDKQHIAMKFDVSADRRELQLSVRDFGPGVEESSLQKIFTLFYRNENELTRETRGTGIGLALVSQYVKLMGGRVSMKNKSPGAEVILVFPVLTDATVRA